MTIELKIPEVGESVREVQIGRWLKQEGDSVAQDENVVELETDKASMELAAPCGSTASAPPTSKPAAQHSPSATSNVTSTNTNPNRPLPNPQSPPSAHQQSRSQKNDNSQRVPRAVSLKKSCQ